MIPRFIGLRGTKIDENRNILSVSRLPMTRRRCQLLPADTVSRTGSAPRQCRLIQLSHSQLQVLKSRD
jgi:hypothetical protein